MCKKSASYPTYADAGAQAKNCRAWQEHKSIIYPPVAPAIASLAFLIWRKDSIYYPAIVRLPYPADPASDRIAWSRSTDNIMRIIRG